MKLINHINTQLLHRRIVLVLFDIMTACVAGVIPLWIRFELNFNDIPNVYLESVWNFMLINVVGTLIVYGPLLELQRRRILWQRAFCVRF